MGNLGNTRITKAYLAQAKTAKISLNTLEKEAIGFANKDIQKQVEDMLFRTNSAYVFMYTKKGIDVVSAHSVISMKKSNKIKIERAQTKDIGSLYEMLLDCWAGDHRLVPYPIDKMDLGRFADYVNAKNVLLIEATRENKNRPKSSFSMLEL